MSQSLHISQPTLGILGVVSLLMITSLGLGQPCSIETQDQYLVEDPSDTNPRTYYGVHLLMISNMYESILIDGYHHANEGNGQDSTVTLQQSNRFHLGLFVLWNESTLIDGNHFGGWIHTKIDITDFNGWISDQNSRQHLKMLGYCGNVTITTYRG